MVSAETQAVVDRAKQIYAERLQAELEAEHRDKFVAIEPESGDHIIADSLDEAARAVRERHPGRRSHVIRVGHVAALHFGVLWV